MAQQMDAQVEAKDPATTSTPDQASSSSSSSPDPMANDELDADSTTSPCQAVSSHSTASRTSESPDHSPRPTASDQILTCFPTCPAEIRNMIYAATVNTPRLLCFDWLLAGPRSELPHSSHAHLPSSLLLNKEAYAEIIKHVKIVQGANEHNHKRFPWSYINPRYDTLCCEFADFLSDLVTSTEIPGIQTSVLRLPNPWLKWLREADKATFFPTWFDLFDQIHGHPDLKELLFVRCLCELVSEDCWFTCRKWYKAQHSPEPRIRLRQHYSSYFGVIDNDTQKMLSQISAEHPLAYLNRDKEEMDNLRQRLTSAYEGRFPDSKMPKITMVYFIPQEHDIKNSLPVSFGDGMTAADMYSTYRMW